ncbi:hypothetical protein V6N11_067676 [Hibiscus sabdariffa]|uniref:Uncharacterized protein n=1 Tax=Hibiscus sabdariffa TaxID=183260 RepID=A0ABR2SRT0_9ROSI
MPDNPSFPALSPLERTGFPASHEDARTTEKAKEDNPSLDSLHDLASFKEGNPVGTVPDVAMDNSQFAQDHTEVSKDGLVIDKVSYANMAARNTTHPENSSISSNFHVDDIVVLEDDYVVDHSGKIPSIKFSNRVHEQIDHSMRNTKIIRLLGRNIGFKTLHARLLGAESTVDHSLISDNPKPSENKLYGPWMTVDTRRHLNIPPTNSNKNVAPKVQRYEVTSGSRFSALNVDEDVGAGMFALSEVGAIIGEGSVVAGAGNNDSWALMNQLKILKNVAYMQSKPPKKSKGVARSNDGKNTGQLSLDQDVVILSQDNAGKSDKHSTVTLDRRYDIHFPMGGKLVKPGGSIGRTQGEGLRRGFSLKKPAELHPLSKPSLHD